MCSLRNETSFQIILLTCLTWFADVSCRQQFWRWRMRLLKLM